MHRSSRVFITTAAVAVSVSLTASVAQQTPADAVFALADRVTADTRDRNSAAVQWMPEDPAVRTAAEKREDERLNELRAIDAKTFDIGSDGWYAYGFLRERLENAAALRVCRTDLWDVDQLNGWQLSVAQGAEQARTDTPEQRAALVARYTRIPAIVTARIARLKDGKTLGYTASRENVRRVIGQLDAMLADDNTSPLTAPSRKTQDEAFRTEWTNVLKTTVRPALTEYRAYLNDTYLAAARVLPGLAANPRGVECYQARVRNYAGIALPPDEQIAIAEKELAALNTELTPIFARLYPGLSLADAKRKLRTDPALMFDTKEAMLAEMHQTLERARLALPKVFSRIPEAPLVVEAYPPYQEQSAAPAAYSAGSPARMMVNTYKPETHSKLDSIIGGVHEGYPGHHFQRISISAPQRRGAGPGVGTSGYSEGWGFYSEFLSGEMGLYRSEAERAAVAMHFVDAWVALSLDAALNAKNATREAVVERTMLETGKTKELAESYADRHAATPGQLATYMMGFREIRDLRQKAAQTMGAAFDVKAFHEEVLKDGPMPLPMFRPKVEKWIAQQAKR